VSTTEQGYGWKHRQQREKWARLVATGKMCCAHCGWPIVPGTLWDLGHVDGSAKTEYAGPEHRRCNRVAGARIGGRKVSQLRIRSRVW